jgi:hypothetical protein
MAPWRGKVRIYNLDQNSRNSKNQSCPKCSDFNAGPLFSRILINNKSIQHTHKIYNPRILECLWSGQIWAHKAWFQQENTYLNEIPAACVRGDLVFNMCFVGIQALLAQMLANPPLWPQIIWISTDRAAFQPDKCTTMSMIMLLYSPCPSSWLLWFCATSLSQKFPDIAPNIPPWLGGVPPAWGSILRGTPHHGE